MDSAASTDTGIYDPTKPLACSIQSADVPDHIALIEQMRSNLTSIARTSHGVVLRWPLSVANRAGAERFAVEEQRCCEFWGFDVTSSQDAVVLRWDGPPATSAFMDRLVAFFEGHAPIGALFSL